jgi:RNA polymerase sigma-70 factor (ECF subfamily)
LAIDPEIALADNHRWIETVVRNRICDSSAADDVMQEIALAVLQQDARPTDPQKVPPWLYRIAVRQTVNYRRRQGRQRHLLQAYSERGERRESQLPNPRDWVLGQELRQSVAEALDRLTPQDREILLLKYTEGWSYGQLADHLGAGVKTIEYRLLRARRALRGHLRQYGEQEQEG